MNSKTHALQGVGKFHVDMLYWKQPISLLINLLIILYTLNASECFLKSVIQKHISNLYRSCFLDEQSYTIPKNENYRQMFVMYYFQNTQN